MNPTTPPSLPASESLPRPGLAILVGGFAAGVFDLIFAFIFYGIRNGSVPSRILQSVAGGWFGKKTFEGGATTILAGLGTHFLISFCMAAVFTIAAMKIKMISRHLVAAGLLYGTMLFFVMNGIVLPLSAYQSKFTFQVDGPTLIVILDHAIGVGLVIALAVRHFAPPSRT